MAAADHARTGDLDDLLASDDDHDKPQRPPAVAASSLAGAPSTDQDEPLLRSTPDRLVLFPIRNPAIWDAYKVAQRAFWTASSIKLADDRADWARLGADEQHFLLHVLAFFAASDGIVNENLAIDFYNEVQLAEARCFYGLQIAMENVHSETYSLLIDTYARSPEEKTRLFSAIETIPCIQRKAEWALRWITSSKSFAERLVAFAVVEGVLFSSSFAAIFYFKRQQRGLPGLTSANDYIARDENMHAQFACLIYKQLVHKLSHATVYEIVAGAIAVEDEFVADALPVALIGMNAREMQQYVRFVADCLLGMLGVPPLYNVANPFPWMVMLGMVNKTNMFEAHVGDYQLADGARVAEDDNDF